MGTQNAIVIVTYPDGKTQEVPVTVTIQDNMADLYDGDISGQAIDEEVITEYNFLFSKPLPTSTEFRLKQDYVASRPSINCDIEIIFPDGSTIERTIPVSVKHKRRERLAPLNVAINTETGSLLYGPDGIIKTVPVDLVRYAPGMIETEIILEDVLLTNFNESVRIGDEDKKFPIYFKADRSKRYNYRLEPKINDVRIYWARSVGSETSDIEHLPYGLTFYQAANSTVEVKWIDNKTPEERGNTPPRINFGNINNRTHLTTKDETMILRKNYLLSGAEAPVEGYGVDVYDILLKSESDVNNFKVTIGDEHNLKDKGNIVVGSTGYYFKIEGNVIDGYKTTFYILPVFDTVTVGKTKPF